MLPDQSPPAKVWTLQENPWGIPGGIANRFGRKALEEMAQSAAETPIEIPDKQLCILNAGQDHAFTHLVFVQHVLGLFLPLDFDFIEGRLGNVHHAFVY